MIKAAIANANGSWYRHSRGTDSAGGSPFQDSEAADSFRARRVNPVEPLVGMAPNDIVARKKSGRARAYRRHMHQDAIPRLVSCRSQARSRSRGSGTRRGVIPPAPPRSGKEIGLGRFALVNDATYLIEKSCERSPSRARARHYDISSVAISPSLHFDEITPPKCRLRMTPWPPRSP